MPQIFHPAFNAVARASLAAGAALLAGGAWIAGAVLRSPYATGTDVVREQPVPFSHRLHAGTLKIDCRYCHAGVETQAFAGMPSTETCMGCHAQILPEAPILEPVRRSWRTGEPIPWVRVHDLPDFTFFDHSIHLARGVACASCHGEVEAMPLLRQARPLFMADCLDCHRHPERHGTPVRASTDCSACHR